MAPRRRIVICDCRRFENIEMYDEEDEELIDDPISLMYEKSPKDNVQNSPKIYVIDDDVEDDPISLVINPNDTDVVDLLSSDDENEEQPPIPKSGYGNKSFVIPVTFLDFYRNVKLLKKCKPLSIKVVDCDKHPWYYGRREATKSSVNVNCLTLGKYSNELMQEIKVEIPDEDTVTLENQKENAEIFVTANQSLNDKAKEQVQINSVDNSVNYQENEVQVSKTRTPSHNYEKVESELKIAKNSKDLSQVDFKRNSGLVGLTISKKDLVSNVDKLIKKKNRKKHRKENNPSKQAMKDIGVALSSLGTSVSLVPEKKDDNGLENLSKDSHSNNVTIQASSLFSDTSDKVNNNTVSPTRCSLKIASTKIFDKVVKLKKAKSKDFSKTKPPHSAKKIFETEQAVPKLNLKRRPTTENDEFYVINSNKKSHFNSSGELSQSQKQQKDQNTVENTIYKKKPVETCHPSVPSIQQTIPVNNQQNIAPNASMVAEKLYQTQSYPTIPTPRSYHKKLKLKKHSLDNDPHKIIQKEPTRYLYSKESNNEDVNASDCSLTPGLNKVVVSQVQSLRDLNTLTPEKSNTETPRNIAFYISNPKDFKYKRIKNIDTAATNSNGMESVNESNGKLIGNGDTTTHDKSARKTQMLQSPSTSYLEVYNAHVLNYYNNLKEVKQKTKPKSTVMNSNKSSSKILKENENTTEMNYMNRQKDTNTSSSVNLNVLNNYDVPSRDTVTSDSNLNNTRIPPNTAVNIQRFNDQKQFDKYFYLKQQLNTPTQPNPTDTVRVLPQIRTQVYNLPGNKCNNTVILRKPPPHIQSNSHQTPGLPIQTIINHRPTDTPQPSTKTFSSWSFPPPNTNVAFSIPTYPMPNMNVYQGSQMYPQYHWQIMNQGKPYHHPPLVVQQETNSNPVPVNNQVPDDSIIGSTASGELIKKINIVGVPANDNTVVDDKQKMLDTLNDAISEQNDFIDNTCDPRLEQARTKPCPLSKKAKINPESDKEPSKGYSPPILPIPSYEKAIELLKMKQKVHNSLVSQIDNIVENAVNAKSKSDKYSHRTVHNTSKRPTIESKKQDKTKKISLEEYKKRISKDCADAHKVPKKCRRKKHSKNVVDNNQDLGYDSDATMKLF